MDVACRREIQYYRCESTSTCENYAGGVTMHDVIFHGHVMKTT